MRAIWRAVAVFLAAACMWGGGGTAWALNPKDAMDCGSANLSPGTASLRLEACTRVLGEMKANRAVAAEALAARALAHTQLQNMDAAIADCTESLRINPANLLCLLVRGGAYGDRRLFPQAFTDLDKALKIKPDFAELYAVRGLVHYGKGSFDSAFADAAEAIRLKPTLALGYVVRAGVHYEKGDRVRALADVNQAIRSQADFDGAYAARAWLYYRMGQAAKSREDAEQALRLDPRSRGALEVRGCLAVDAQDTEAALADLTQAIDMGSQSQDAFLCRATALERSGGQDQAAADYRKVLSLPLVGRDSRELREKARQRLAALKSGPPEQAQKTQAVTASAEAVTAPDRRIALVIGMSDYANVTPLTNSATDAHAVAEAFRRLGFAEVVEQRDLTRTQFEQALKDFGDRASAADWAVIYYAGHGVEVDGVNYLIPVDARLARAEHVEDETLPLARLLSKAEPARKLRLVILDACRNNPFKMAAAGRTRSIGRGLGRIEPSGGVLVAYAARDGATADDGAEGHSPFTQALLDNVEKPGLEISLLFRKIRNAVLSSTGNRQEPFTYGSLPDEGLYFKQAGK